MYFCDALFARKITATTTSDCEIFKYGLNMNWKHNYISNNLNL